MNIQELSGQTQTYKEAFQVAGEVLIEAQLNQGRKFILCDELFTTLNAVDMESQKGIRLAILFYTTSGRLVKVGNHGEGLYKVDATVV